MRTHEATSYFEHQERTLAAKSGRRSTQFDVVEFPGITVTESEPDADTLLLMDLARTAA